MRLGLGVEHHEPEVPGHGAVERRLRVAARRVVELVAEDLERPGVVELGALDDEDRRRGRRGRAARPPGAVTWRDRAPRSSPPRRPRARTRGGRRGGRPVGAPSARRRRASRIAEAGEGTTRSSRTDHAGGLELVAVPGRAVADGDDVPTCRPRAPRRAPRGSSSTGVVELGRPLGPAAVAARRTTSPRRTSRTASTVPVDAGVARRLGEHVGARDRDEPDAARDAEPLGRRHADAQPGEQARPDVDDDRVEVRHRPAARGEQPGEARGERLGVPAPVVGEHLDARRRPRRRRARSRPSRSRSRRASSRRAPSSASLADRRAREVDRQGPRVTRRARRGRRRGGRGRSPRRSARPTRRSPQHRRRAARRARGPRPRRRSRSRHRSACSRTANGRAGSAAVVVHERVGRRRHDLGDPEGRGVGLDEGRLARAETAGEHHEPPRRGVDGQGRRAAARVVHRVAHDDRRAAHLGAASACFARTRSARIWATTPLPPRSA